MLLYRQDGGTSLVAAAQSGREAMVRQLLESKADPSAADQVQQHMQLRLPSI